MEVDEKPTEDYNDIGGLDKQIEELIEAVVLPMNHKERFDALGIKPPKGVLLYGPPGTGKTLMARACAAQTNCCFLKLAAPQLVQVKITHKSSNHSSISPFFPCQDVYWRRKQTRARYVCPGQRKERCHYLYR